MAQVEVGAIRCLTTGTGGKLAMHRARSMAKEREFGVLYSSVGPNSKNVSWGSTPCGRIVFGLRGRRKTAFSKAVTVVSLPFQTHAWGESCGGGKLPIAPNTVKCNISLVRGRLVTVREARLKLFPRAFQWCTCRSEIRSRSYGAGQNRLWCPKQTLRELNPRRKKPKLWRPRAK